MSCGDLEELCEVPQVLSTQKEGFASKALLLSISPSLIRLLR